MYIKQKIGERKIRAPLSFIPFTFPQIWRDQIQHHPTLFNLPLTHSLSLSLSRQRGRGAQAGRARATRAAAGGARAHKRRAAGGDRAAPDQPRAASDQPRSAPTVTQHGRTRGKPPPAGLERWPWAAARERGAAAQWTTTDREGEGDLA